MQKMNGKAETISIKPQGRLSNVIKRVCFGTLMISGFLYIIWMGPIMLMGLVFAIQVLCFSEILRIGYKNNHIPESLPHFRSLCYYFLVSANYFLFVEVVAPHFHDFYRRFDFLKMLIKYNRFISFCIYFIGMILFVLSLVKKHLSKQFKLLAWAHTLLIIIVAQSYMIIENIFIGLIWLILPSSLVILNDIFGYIFGRWLGKTPLIELSPKKTWEGFLGAILGTFASGYILSTVMCQYKYFICPVEYYYTNDGLIADMDCIPSELFNPTNYFLGFIPNYPFTFHFLFFAFFASIFAPFGGFFASGFKRAFHIKDFGDCIPGHGGITDRFDCQFLMATFVNSYVFAFIRIPTVKSLFVRTMYLEESEQVEVYNMLRNLLESSGYSANLTAIP